MNERVPKKRAGHTVGTTVVLRAALAVPASPAAILLRVVEADRAKGRSIQFEWDGASNRFRPAASVPRSTVRPAHVPAPVARLAPWSSRSAADGSGILPPALLFASAGMLWTTAAWLRRRPAERLLLACSLAYAIRLAAPGLAPLGSVG